MGNILRIVVGFEAGFQRRGMLREGDVYIAVDRAALPKDDREYLARWDGCRPQEIKPAT